MDTTHRGRRLRLAWLAGLVALAGLGISAHAQQKQKPAAPPMARVPAPPAPTSQIRRNVNMVALPVTVVDKQGNFIETLKQDNFKVYEDGVEQKISLFSREDIPVTMGLVIDNSGSMRNKLPRVTAAALTLVETSNREDQVFVVNFNEDYYLDQQSDFTNSIPVLKEALERIDARGSTALYDAVLASLHHLKKGHRDKKVLVVITDGEDDASQHSLQYTVRAAQKSDAIIYTVGLLSQEDHGAARRAKRALEALSEATGGLAFFPNTVAAVRQICLRIATDIRHQYLIGYYPTNPQTNGGFRHVKVKLENVPHGLGKLFLRTRLGYYAEAPPAAPRN